MTDILQILGGGAIAAMGLFFSNVLLDKYRAPKLVLKRTVGLEKRRISIKFFDKEIDNYRYVKSTPYQLHRIRINNDGRNAAENCTAILDFGYSQWKLIWKSSKSETTTINTKSFDYLDICSILLDKKEDILNWINMTKKEVDKVFDEDLPDYTVKLQPNNKLELLKEEIARDYPSKDHIMNILYPFEDGWNHFHREYVDRYIESGKSEGVFYKESKNAKIIVSAKNAAPLEFKIKINAFPDKTGSYITVEEENNSTVVLQ